MKKSIYVVALVYLFTFIGHFVVSFIRAWGAAHGGVPTWALDQASAVIALNVFGLIAMVATWIGGIYYWSQLRTPGTLHGIALVVLVVLGIFVAPFYILITASELKVWKDDNVEPSSGVASSAG